MKKLLVFAAFLLAASFANAASVVWRYSDPHLADTDTSNMAVKLVAWNGETSTDCQILTSLGEYSFAAVDSAEVYSVIPTGSGLADLKFSVQLFSFDENDQAQLVAQSATVTYKELYEKNAIFFDVATTPNPTAYDFAAAIPEPTGSLLLLVGFAALALKRKPRD